MSEALIVRDDSRRSISFTPEAIEMKEAALATAGLIGRVSSAEENANAVEAQKELKRVIGKQECKVRRIPGVRCQLERDFLVPPPLDLARPLSGFKYP